MTLREENAALKAQNATLVARVQELEARLAMDSHNSSKSPSSNGLGRKTKGLRRRSGKKPGGQLGHRGETLRLVATPDVVVEHRQVRELAALRLVVREHQALHARCPHCQTVSVGTFPAEASSRAQYRPRLRALAVYLLEQQFVPYARMRELFADLVGTSLSLGTLLTWVQQSVVVLAPVEARLKAALARAAVLHHDETGVRRDARLA